VVVGAQVRAPISSSTPPAAPAAAPAGDEAVFLSDEAVIEEPKPTPVEPAPSAVSEEMVVSDGDFVREEDTRGFTRGGTSSGFGEDEIERESSYEAPVASEAPAVSDARRITVPIDLGKFPPSGKLKVTFEVRIELDEESKRSSRPTHGTIEHER
jgi:hypothetical protein